MTKKFCQLHFISQEPHIINKTIPSVIVLFFLLSDSIQVSASARLHSSNQSFVGISFSARNSFAKITYSYLLICCKSLLKASVFLKGKIQIRIQITSIFAYHNIIEMVTYFFFNIAFTFIIIYFYFSGRFFVQLVVFVATKISKCCIN